MLLDCSQSSGSDVAFCTLFSLLVPSHSASSRPVSPSHTQQANARRSGGALRVLWFTCDSTNQRSRPTLDSILEWIFTGGGGTQDVREFVG